ncbi:MAG: phosphoglucosamine mutase, partial [Candidatus Altiarchaeales archaeon HGW-Altiarchaeales-3]
KVIDIDGIKILHEDSAWMLLRPSGTEPIFRVFVEAPGDKRAKELMEEGLKTVNKAVADLKN